MLEKRVVKEFLVEKLDDWETKIPININIDELTEAFCDYVEIDYIDWLTDNCKSFFTVGPDGIDWKNIRRKISKSRKSLSANS